jgi:hypothetical protein
MNANVTAKKAERWPTAWEGERLDVAIGPKLTTLVNTTETEEGTITINSGSLAARIFSGRPDSPWRIELVSSRFRGYVVPGTDLLLTTSLVRYSLLCKLSGPQVQRHLTATGQGNAWNSVGESATKAVDDALCLIGDQVQAIMLDAKCENE